MSSGGNNADLSRAIRRWVEAIAPGHRAVWVRIQLDSEQGRWISLPVGPASEPETEEPREESRRDPGNSRCALDILEVLQAVGHRLTTTRLLAEMAQRSKDWSERTVAGCLARMVEDGTLTNDSHARPRGYGLPEWE